MAKSIKRPEKELFVTYQYQKDLQIPVYVKLPLAEFSNEISSFLKSMNFEKLKENESELAQSSIESTPNAKLLLITEAGSTVARQIDQVQESDQFGKESLVPKEGYKIYRYKSVAMIIYSFAAYEWQMAAFSDFGTIDQNINIYRTVITRYLSWALAPLGIIGFWGTPTKEGAVILKQQEANGEAIFFDVNKGLLLTLDGIKKVHPRFKIIRLVPSLKTGSRLMSKEELYSFLSQFATFLDFQGSSVAIRQMIQILSHSIQGVLIPKQELTSLDGPSII